MQVGKNNEFHLTYCSNIHPGETWEEVFSSLEQHALQLKRELSPDDSFGLGLRLSNQAAETLLSRDNLSEFRRWLDEQGFYVFTLNGFPYGSFHRSIVKDTVYQPDWQTSERADYTMRLIRILSALLPEGIEGGISTSPLSYKPWLTDEAMRNRAFEESTQYLVKVAAHLLQVRFRGGSLIHIDIEPEPDCLIENISETVGYFKEWLFPRGGKLLADLLGISIGDATEYLRDHIRLCYDTCHFAVEYEKAEDVWTSMQDHGIKVGKVQVSAAVKVELPASIEARDEIAGRLEPFAESTYLHQVIERRTDGTLVHYNDLPDALPHVHQALAEEWRIHFHVPIFVDDYKGIQSTRGDIVDALGALKQNPVCSHLEIETYTWDVLPDGLKEDLTTSIRREYEWVLDQF